MMMSQNYLLSKMTWDEAKEKAQRGAIAILPVGSTEQHGLHLPLEMDALLATELSDRIAKEASRDVEVVVAPTIPYGAGPISHAKIFPGTLFLSLKLLKEVVTEICEGLYLSGFRKIVILDCHGGNPPAISNAVREFGTKFQDAVVVSVNPIKIVQEVIQKYVKTQVSHACEMETSMALALNARVIMEKAKDTVPKSKVRDIVSRFNASQSGDERFSGMGAKNAVDFPWGWQNFEKVTPTGVVGEPTKATKEKGEKIVEAMVGRVANLVRELSRA